MGALEEVVGSAVGRMEDQLGDRPLILDLAEAWVPLDPVLLEQVLLNLLDNALKFSPPGSGIEIEGRVRARQAGSRCPTTGRGSPKAKRSGCSTSSTGQLLRGDRGRRPGPRHLPGHHPGPRRYHQGRSRPLGGAQITLTLPVEGAPPELLLDSPS